MRFCVQVKNKPCTRRAGYMRLISWIHPRGSRTIPVSKTGEFSKAYFSLISFIRKKTYKK
jgi:hypothetical protein